MRQLTPVRRSATRIVLLAFRLIINLLYSTIYILELYTTATRTSRYATVTTTRSKRTDVASGRWYPIY
jgi:hypothetical protein